jgi:hypothetical protein
LYSQVGVGEVTVVEVHREGFGEDVVLVDVEVMLEVEDLLEVEVVGLVEVIVDDEVVGVVEVVVDDELEVAEVVLEVELLDGGGGT